jgi:hypothetical protein
MCRLFEQTWDNLPPDEMEELHRRAEALFDGSYHLLAGVLRDIEAIAEDQIKLLEVVPNARG